MLVPSRPPLLHALTEWERRYDGPLPGGLGEHEGEGRQLLALARSRALDRTLRHLVMALAARRRDAPDLAGLEPMASRLARCRRAALAWRQAARG